MKVIAIILFLSVVATEGFAQSEKATLDQLAERLSTYAPKEAPTSVYLRTDKDVYGSGEDLWFSAFVLDSKVFTLSEADKTLYVQLQQKHTDSIVWSEMYPIVNGLSSGHVYLPQTLPEGEYILKAYTKHSFFSRQSWFYALASITVVKEFRSIRRNNNTQPPAKEPVQFNVFPEGGNLIAGLQNRVAFKAVGKNGDPVEVSGTLLKNNEAVCSFETTHAGMGSFLFKPEKNAVYRIRLENNKDSLYNIPKIQESGVLMHLVKNEKDSLVFKIASSLPDRKTVFLRLQVRGMVQAMALGTLKDSLIIKVPVNDILQGLAEATLFDDQQRPLAERLLFLHPEKRLNISFSELKEQYQPKEKVTVKIRTTDATGKPVPAVLSLSVHDQLFTDPRNAGDIVTYYQLATQLRGRIYNPSYYFDAANKDRVEALDLLLLSQGWRAYTWNEDVLGETTAAQKQVLSDSLPVRVTPLKKAGKEKLPASLMFFNYNRSILQAATPASDNTFYLSPENLMIGSRFFIQYLSEKDYSVQVSDPFAAINNERPTYIFMGKNTGNKRTVIDTSFLQYGKRLQEVTVIGKGRGFGDKYLGALDSIAKYEGNTDFVGACGILNCPACGGGTKPVEGTLYSELTSARKAQVVSHPFPFVGTDIIKVTYKYPKYTEEELLKKFRLTVTKGYYQSRKFYEPAYDKEDKAVTDIRNVLLWAPIIVTDQNGETTITFFSSDIRGRFQGKIEGVDGQGSLGSSRFTFNVNSQER